ncbi:transposase family protein [Streptomyces flavidovirens]|uniref:transposase family protein n=1 Tax=Streptomyces flavidovirens TaxID=67298 RepID=UPI0036949691
MFVDRLLAALVHLRHGATHGVLACWFGVVRVLVYVLSQVQVNVLRYQGLARSRCGRGSRR